MGAQARLVALITGALRGVLGSTPLGVILSPERAQKLTLIRQLLNKGCSGLGIEVVDVRIRRADLPLQNSQAIFNRMISERQKEAQETRAEGMERAEIIRAEADLECTTLRANARQKAQEEKGLADRKALRIIGEAYAKNPEFAAFYQSLTAYPEALKDAQYFLTPDGDFFQYFKKKDMPK
jgi:membrane protease subunit HflC